MSKSGFIFIMIRPTHYDDDGYPIRWRKTFVPSNSMASVYGLAKDCQVRKVLGDDTPIELIALDEPNTAIDHAALIEHIRDSGAKALVGMIGVQTNQFPRAVDLSGPFLDAGIPVCIGGFHVSGCLSMLDEMPEDLKAAQAMGISFFAGEAEEGRLDSLFKDAYDGKLKPVYNYLNALPTLENEPTPFITAEQVDQTFLRYSSFDLGRGCPFDCSFCTIINVQGKKSRFRTPDDVERILRENHAIGVDKFFLTDDNFARNRNWEPCLDRMIELREKEGIKARLMIQVDTICHKIPRFVEKCCRAGVEIVFFGLESINQDNIADVGKKQNKVSDYKELLLSWKRFPVITVAGYIIGLPHDTKESILRDIETIQRDLPIDMLYFTMLQPLPGCEDHKRLLDQGIWMDDDMNKYDLHHRVTHHPNISDADWEEVFRLCWERFFSYEHMETVLRRMVALGSNKKFMTVVYLLSFRNYARLYNVSPLEAGYFKIKRRRDRRPGLPLENPLIFYPKYFYEIVTKCGTMFLTYYRLRRMMKKILKDPKRMEYTDSAVTRAAFSVTPPEAA